MPPLNPPRPRASLAQVVAPIAALTGVDLAPICLAASGERVLLWSADAASIVG
jgi:hypothetical protein